MKRLQRLGTWIVIWLALTNLLQEWAGLHLWQPVTYPKKTAQVAALWAADRDPEVIVIGSSVARRSFAPAVMEEAVRSRTGREVTAFNLGIDGTDALMADSLLRATLRRYQPRVVVYAASMHAFHAKYYHPRSAGRFLAYYASPREVLIAPAPGGTIYGQFEARLSALFRPLQLPFQWLLQSTSDYPQALAAARRTGGWNRVERRRTHELRWERRRTPDLRLVPRAWTALERMARRAERRGVGLLVLNLPHDRSNPNLQSSLEPLRQFAVLLERFCAERRIACRDVDGGEVGLLPADYDQDGGHLLASGAVKLSRHVAERLVVPMLGEG